MTRPQRKEAPSRDDDSEEPLPRGWIRIGDLIAELDRLAARREDEELAYLKGDEL